MHNTDSIKHKEIYYYLTFKLFLHNLANHTPVLTELIKHYSGKFIDLCVLYINDCNYNVRKIRVLFVVG
jgi:hypothetical protein